MYCALKMFFVCLMLTTLAQAVPQLPAQPGLARLFFTSRFAVQDPAHSIKCFNNYSTTSSEVNSKYSTTHQKCSQNSKDGRKAADAAVNSERQNIAALAMEVVQRINDCNMLEDSLEYFSCHAESGSPNTKATYIISANSSDYVTILQERYRTIQLNEEKCYSSCERIYVQDTTATFDRLQNCLQGLTPPTESTTTTTTTTTQKPVEEPQQPEAVAPNTEDPIDLQRLLGLAQ